MFLSIPNISSRLHLNDGENGVTDAKNTTMQTVNLSTENGDGVLNDDDVFDEPMYPVDNGKGSVVFHANPRNGQEAEDDYHQPQGEGQPSDDPEIVLLHVDPNTSGESQRSLAVGYYGSEDADDSSEASFDYNQDSISRRGSSFAIRQTQLDEQRRRKRRRRLWVAYAVVGVVALIVVLILVLGRDSDSGNNNKGIVSTISSSADEVASLNETASPTASPFGSPTVSPIVSPTDSPTPAPIRVPTGSPTPAPTQSPIPPQPTGVPSSGPSVSPTETQRPTNVPSLQPSWAPFPTASPSASPSLRPSTTPSDAPSSLPSPTPTSIPTLTPSMVPTWQPSNVPSSTPSGKPSMIPSSGPSTQPTSIPSESPTISWMPTITCQDWERFTFTSRGQQVTCESLASRTAGARALDCLSDLCVEDQVDSFCAYQICPIACQRCDCVTTTPCVT